MNLGVKFLSPFPNHVKNLRDFVLDIIFPVECQDCGKHGAWLCQKCFRKLEINGASFCLHCGKQNNFGEFCNECKSRFFLDGVWIAGNYDQAVLAKLIKTFKYRFTYSLSQTLGEYLCHFLNNFLNQHRFNISNLKNGLRLQDLKNLKEVPEIILDFQNALLIPVPLHKKRLKWRGFNQAELLAEVIAENFGLEMDAVSLKRILHKKAQAKLRGRERYLNLKDCFVWTGESLAGRNILLIDDVSTTGSTLNECAAQLKKAGASEVWGLVLAKG
jgi:ComF family protein